MDAEKVKQGYMPFVVAKAGTPFFALDLLPLRLRGLTAVLAEGHREIKFEFRFHPPGESKDVTDAYGSVKGVEFVEDSIVCIKLDQVNIGDEQVLETATLRINYKRSNVGSVTFGAGFDLWLAAGFNDKKIAAELLNNNANTEGPDLKFLPLHRAVKCGHLHMMRLLVNRGAKVNSYNDKYQTALYLAAKCYDKQIVEFLLENGADVNLPVCEGDYTVFHRFMSLAPVGDYLEIMELFLEHVEDVNRIGQPIPPAPSGRGWTPLHLLVTQYCESDRRSDLHYREAVGLLLKHGAEPNVIDASGRTALDIVNERNVIGDRQKLAELLLANGAKPANEL